MPTSILPALPDERQQIILERLSRRGRVLAGDLAREFRTSEDTIRRDLREMAAAGQCRRVYGGALPLSPASGALAARRAEAPERKAALGRAAAPPGASGPGRVFRRRFDQRRDRARFACRPRRGHRHQRARHRDRSRRQARRRTDRHRRAGRSALGRGARGAGVARCARDPCRSGFSRRLRRRRRGRRRRFRRGRGRVQAAGRRARQDRRRRGDDR